MENPYWATAGNTHRISRQSVERRCLDLVGLIFMSRAIAEGIEERELEEGCEFSPKDDLLFSVHSKLCSDLISEHLLNLSLMVRTYDDIMRRSSMSEKYQELVECSKYDEWVAAPGKGDFKITLREACNKIIHAEEIRPICERLDRQVNSHGLEQDIWYYTGEVDLMGKHKGQEWWITLRIEDFVEASLERLSFQADD